MRGLACPTDFELRAYLLGETSGTELEAVAAHLETCPRCEAAAATLDGLADPLIDGLRKYQPAPVDRAAPDPLRVPAGERARGQRGSPPGYEILELLGRGGMGVVYRARQLAVGRVVALKMVLTGDLATPGERERFRFEAEMVGQLAHPNVVQIFEAGSHEGQPFFALELVPGGSLADRLRRGPLPPPDAAALVEQLSRGVHHAHLQGIVHRDLKPANVLLAADGTPKVSDFGLGRRFAQGPGSALTVPGLLLGTPSYMAPEQVGAAQRVGPAADVYALGGILFACLTGEPPFTGETTAEIVANLQTREPPPVSRPGRPVPRDLATVCRRCLEKDPAQRYRSAEALADDLARFLSGEPVHARPVGPAVRLVKWARRRPTAAALSAAMALFVAVAFAVVLDQKRRAERAAGDERDARGRAEDALARNRTLAAAIALDEAAALCEKGETGRGLVSFVRGLDLARLAGDGDLERAARFNLTAWSRGLARHRATCRTESWCNSAVLSGDDRLLLTGTLDRHVRLWSVATGAPLCEPFATEHPVWSVDFGPAPYAAAISGGGTRGGAGEVRVWDIRSGTAARTLKTPAPVFKVAYHPGHGRTFMTATEEGIQLWSAETFEHVGEALTLASAVQSGAELSAAEFSPDGRFVLAAGRIVRNGAGASGVARLWDADGRKLLGEMTHEHPIVTVAFSPDGRFAATGGRDGTSQVWSLPACVPVGKPHRHAGAIRALAFSPDGRVLATGSEVGAQGPLPDRDTGVRGGEARLWDVATGEPRTVPLVHNGPVEAVALSPSGRRLLTGNVDGFARLFSTADGAALGDPLFGAGNVRTVRFSSDGRLAVTASVGNSARIWELPAEEAGPYIPVDALPCVAYSPDGTVLVSGTEKGTVQLWEAATRGEKRRLDYGGPVWSVAETWSPRERVGSSGGAFRRPRPASWRRRTMTRSALSLTPRASGWPAGWGTSCACGTARRPRRGSFLT